MLPFLMYIRKERLHFTFNKVANVMNLRNMIRKAGPACCTMANVNLSVKCPHATRTKELSFLTALAYHIWLATC